MNAKEKKKRIEKAKTVIAKIWALCDNEGNGDSSLTKATDAMYDYIKQIENL